MLSPGSHVLRCFRAVATILTLTIATTCAASSILAEQVSEPLPEGALARLETSGSDGPRCQAPVSLSGDGSRIAVAAEDRSIALFEWPSGTRLRSFAGHAMSVTDVSLSRDGGLLASGGLDGVLNVWDTDSGRNFFSKKVSDGLDAVAVSPGAEWVAAAGGADGRIVIWSKATGKVSSTLEGNWDLVLALAFSPGKGLLASCSDDASIRIWDVQSGSQMQLFRIPRGGQEDRRPWAACFSGDGRMLLAGDSTGRLRLYDLASGSLAWMTRSGAGEVASCAFVTGSYSFATLASAGRLEMYAPWSKEPLSTRTAFPTGVKTKLEVADSGNILVTGGRGNSAVVWDASGVGKLASDRLSTFAPTLPDLKAAWDDLGSFDGKRGWNALLTMLVRSMDSPSILRDHLLEAPAADLKAVLRQASDLNSDDPETREKATADLLTADIDPFLDEALKAATSPEAMTRLTQLIRTRREGPKASCAGDLRRMRAVQVLEILGTEDARKILAKVPDSSPYPRACREAREALRRMGRR